MVARLARTYVEISGPFSFASIIAPLLSTVGYRESREEWRMSRQKLGNPIWWILKNPRKMGNSVLLAREGGRLKEEG